MKKNSNMNFIRRNRQRNRNVSHRNREEEKKEEGGINRNPNASNIDSEKE